MTFSLMSEDDPRKKDFGLNTPPERWIVLHDGGIHAYDSNRLHRWDEEVYKLLVRLVKKHDLCFVLVGSKVDFENAETACMKAGMDKFPFIVCYDEPIESKAYMKHADAVISNQCTLLRAGQDMHDLAVCLRMTTVESFPFAPHVNILDREQHSDLDAWLSKHSHKFKGA